jgi:hypothetical protein
VINVLVVLSQAIHCLTLSEDASQFLPMFLPYEVASGSRYCRHVSLILTHIYGCNDGFIYNVDFGKVVNYVLFFLISKGM